MSCGYTGKRLFDMRKSKSPACIFCGAEIDHPVHFMLSCPAFTTTRTNFITKLMAISPTLSQHYSASPEFLLSILDPFSPRVPLAVRNSWKSKDEVYKISRNFCYSMHKARTKLLKSLAEDS